MVICKICEKDIQEHKLGPHSLKCKEVAKLKEELLQIQTKMKAYSENAHRMKRSLETQATKLKNLQQKRLESRPVCTSLETLPQPKTPRTTQLANSMKDEIPGFRDEDIAKSREGVGNNNETMTEEEYKIFTKQTKLGIIALTSILVTASKIDNGTSDNVFAIEVNFNTKNELVALYNDIVDTNLSKFLEDFISDLTRYLDVHSLYLKKRADLLVFDVDGEPNKIPTLNKFLGQKSTSFRGKQDLARKSNFQPRAKIETPIPENDSEDSTVRTPRIEGIENFFENRFGNGGQQEGLSPENHQVPTQEQSLVDRLNLKESSPKKSDTEDSDRMESAPIRRGHRKKTSKLIKVDNMRIMTIEEKSQQPSIKICYVEDPAGEPKEPQSGQLAKKSQFSRMGETQSKFLTPKSSTKKPHLNFFNTLQREEQGNHVAFPSLQEKGEMDSKKGGHDIKDEFDESPKNPLQLERGESWDSPLLKGYYTDDFSKTKSSRMLSMDSSARLQIDEFEFLKYLGKGAYGTVWLVKKKTTNDLYAMKIVNWADRFTQNRIQALKAERDIYEILQGDYVVKAVWTFHFQNFICFVTEYMLGGDFNKILDDVGRLDEDQARFYFAQLVKAIDALHELGIVHRDLKPENILMDSKGHIRLTDFGLSENGLSKLRQNASPEPNKKPPKYFGELIMKKSTSEHPAVALQKRGLGQLPFMEKRSSNIFAFLDKQDEAIPGGKKKVPIKKSLEKTAGVQRKVSKVGTPDYMAPEVIEPDRIEVQSYNEKCMDWWSMGVILYQFLVGIPPFCDENLDNVFDNILNKRLEWPPIGDEEDCISAMAYDLIQKLLEPNPAKRLGVNGAQEVKQHPFFKGLNWDTLHEENGPIVPDSNISDILESVKKEQSNLNLESLPFGRIGNNANKGAAAPSVDLEKFQLTRLDVLDKLNQKEYEEIKKKKPEQESLLTLDDLNKKKMLEKVNGVH